MGYQVKYLTKPLYMCVTAIITITMTAKYSIQVFLRPAFTKTELIDSNDILIN